MHLHKPVGIYLTCIVPSIWLAISVYVAVRLILSEHPFLENVATNDYFVKSALLAILTSSAVYLLLGLNRLCLMPFVLLVAFQMYVLLQELILDPIVPLALLIPGILLAVYSISSLYIFQLYRRGVLT